MARITALLAIALLATSALAAPLSPASSSRSLRAPRLNFSPEVASVHVRNVASASPRYLTSPVSSFGPVDAVRAGLDFAASVLESDGINFRDYIVTDSYTTEHNGVTHVYLRQVVDGLQVSNANMNINIAKDGSIISYGNSFFTGDLAPRAPNAKAVSFLSSPARLTAVDALNAFASRIGKQTTSFVGEPLSVHTKEDDSVIIKNVPFAVSEVPAKMVYIQSEGELKLGWELTIEMEENWYNTVVDAANGEVLSAHDWVADSSYNVYPFNVNDPEDGDRQVIKNPEDLTASPAGWNTIGTTKYTVTRGNNVAAQENLSGGSTWENNKRPDGGDALTYDFPIDFTKNPTTYIDASVSQLFFTNNKIHDLFYKYGFDEVSGNFQDNNFGKGGLDGDGVIANAQDGSGTNNANFATPPDGQRGRMRMYVWTPNPQRDGDLEAGIVIHEYAHGISNRLTGGPANSNCLANAEGGGMGEGWGDFFATLIRQRKDNRATSFPMGAYASRNANGIRNYVYSTDLKVNPETYSYISKPAYVGVHPKGAIWANILYEAFVNLSTEHGFSEDIFNPKLTTGNVVLLQNVVDGLKLQPCNPTFIDARDAILLADKTNYNSKHTCLLWKAFAKRGLGVNAKAGGIEDFTLPATCI